MSKHKQNQIEKLKSFKSQLEALYTSAYRTTDLSKTVFIDDSEKFISTEDLMGALKAKTEDINRIEYNYPSIKIAVSLSEYKKILVEFFAAAEMLSKYEDQLFSKLNNDIDLFKQDKKKTIENIENEIKSIYLNLNLFKVSISFRNLDNYEQKLSEILDFLKNKNGIIFSSKGHVLYLQCDTHTYNLLLSEFENILSEKDFSIIKSQINKHKPVL